MVIHTAANAVPTDSSWLFATAIMVICHESSYSDPWKRSLTEKSQRSGKHSTIYAARECPTTVREWPGIYSVSGGISDSCRSVRIGVETSNPLVDQVV
jgi:hypothetical protein